MGLSLARTRDKLLAIRDRLLAAVVRIFGRETFTLLAAVDCLASHPCSAEAVGRPQQHEDTDQRRRDVNAPRHSPTIYQILRLASRRPNRGASEEPRVTRVHPPHDPRSIPPAC